VTLLLALVEVEAEIGGGVVSCIHFIDDFGNDVIDNLRQMFDLWVVCKHP
jgi:hypothetical protein